jgi:S1-C subfamily serine protease
MALRKTLFVVGVLIAGFAGGLVVSGRMSTTSSSTAAPAAPAPQARPASMPGAINPPSSAALPDLSSVAERAIQASVNITSTQYVQDPWMQMWYGPDSVRAQTSLGSGVVVSPDGYVLTNNHVIGNARAEIKVTLADNSELPAKIVGVDSLTDLAVVKIDARSLNPLPWGDSSKIRVAEWVLAIGNPFSLGQTVTFGIVSSANRHDAQLASYNDFIQTDAAVNPGNSGGALINARGELIGINSMIYSQTGGYQGITFAIPSNLARSIMEELKTKGEIVRGSIGNLQVRTISADDARRARLGNAGGVYIDSMYRNDPAYRAGLQPEDIIVRFRDKDVSDAGQFMRLVADTPVGTTVRVEVIREGRRQAFDVPVVKMTAPRRRY